MIIVLCGIAGSGKDTIADILVNSHGFQKESFAKPIKEMVKLAYPDFTDYDLYGPSERRSRPYKQYPRTDQTYTYPECPHGALWVPLSRERGWTLISEEDLPSVALYKWTLNTKGRENRTHYAKTDTRTATGKRSLSLHRYLMSPADDLMVDHINGDGLDNRRDNLRICTLAENRRNERKRIPTDGKASSPFKGAIWDAERNLWQGRINIAGATTNLGRFSDEQDAALAYDIAAKKAFGPFARLNSDLFLTPRRALQELGTAWGRRLYIDTWVDSAFARINTDLAHLVVEYSRYQQLGVGSIEGYPQHYVITDGRFHNEVLRSNALGAITVRLNRGLDKPVGTHASEAEFPSIPRKDFCLCFDNGEVSLEDLPGRVETLYTAATCYKRNALGARSATSSTPTVG